MMVLFYLSWKAAKIHGVRNGKPMKKLVTLKAKFANKHHFDIQWFDEFTSFYDDTGQPLTPEDKEKLDRIQWYYVHNNIYFVFVPCERILDDNAPITAESWIDLAAWTKDALPMFRFKNIQTGQFEDLPRVKSGRKPKKKMVK